MLRTPHGHRKLQRAPVGLSNGAISPHELQVIQVIQVIYLKCGQFSTHHQDLKSLGCQRSESKSGMAIWASWNAEKRPGENPRHGWWRWWLRDHSSSRQILGALSGFAFAVSLVSGLGFKTDLSFPNSGTWFQQIQEPSVTIWEKTIVISFHCFCFQLPVFASFQ